jgi:hypothetical protein
MVQVAPGLLRIEQRLCIPGVEIGTDVAGPACPYAVVQVRRGSVLYQHGDEVVRAPRRFALFLPPFGVVQVTVITAFQSTVAPDVRGRVMALVVALSTAAVPVGMALGGVLGDHWRGSLHLVFAGSGVTIAILAGSSSVVRGFDDAFERSHGEQRSAALPR